MAASRPAAAGTSQADDSSWIELTDDYDDTDSTLSLPLSNSLSSLRSGILTYQHENGRTYHAMSAGKYMFPNDEAENERLDLQHHIMRMTLDNRLCLCPKNEGAKRVLDLGTGTGIWAIDYADEHPEAEVFGVDLSPSQPSLIPPNCSFEVDDLEKEWTWSKPFDLIMCRMMNGSFSDPGSIVEKAFDQLEPGGYLEVQDMGFPLCCDDGTLKTDSDLWTWICTVMKAFAAAGRPATVAQRWKALLEDAGFEDVVEVVEKWPINTWPRDPKYKNLGKWTLHNLDQALEMSVLAPLTRVLGWTQEEALMLAAKAREDLKNTRIHAYAPIYIVYGRKPAGAHAPHQVRQGTPETSSSYSSWQRCSEDVI